VKTIETITPGSVDTIPGKNNRNHNSRLCRTEPGVMIFIVFIWDFIYRAWSYGFHCFYMGLYLQSLELWFLLFLPVTPGSVDTIPAKNNRNHNSRLCRYNPR
jgi:hypothetical protein